LLKQLKGSLVGFIHFLFELQNVVGRVLKILLELGTLGLVLLFSEEALLKLGLNILLLGKGLLE
jgi:hypothetical protein